MDEKLLIETYPLLYHMAEPDSWPSIKLHGLLSTEALLDHYSASSDERVQILSSYRPSMQNFRNVVIRDQAPMKQNIARCLPEAIPPSKWFAFLNRKVFFWTTVERLDRFKAAYRNKRQVILVIPTQRMVEAHRERATLCHINSGAARMPNHFRDFETFQPIHKFLYSSKRKPAEFTVDYSVPDISQLVSRVSECGEGPEKVLFSCA